MLLRKTLSQGGRGDKLVTMLMKHIEKEMKKLGTATSSFNTSTSVRTFHTQRGQYSVHVSAPTGQSASAVNTWL